MGAVTKPSWMQQELKLTMTQFLKAFLIVELILVSVLLWPILRPLPAVVSIVGIGLIQLVGWRFWPGGWGAWQRLGRIALLVLLEMLVVLACEVFSFWTFIGSLNTRAQQNMFLIYCDIAVLIGSVLAMFHVFRFFFIPWLMRLADWRVRISRPYLVPPWK